MSKSRAFTLIESLAVVSIIGILATITFYGLSSYQRAARDATRKSDVFALSQGFEARFLDQTCGDQSQVGRYPNVITNPNATMMWLSVKGLAKDSACNGFSSYLTVIPSDPQSSYDYYFNLNPSFAGFTVATHYRIAASLEKNNATSCTADTTESGRWVNTYGGISYDCPDLSPTVHAQFGNPSRSYDYYFGK